MKAICRHILLLIPSILLVSGLSAQSQSSVDGRFDLQFKTGEIEFLSSEIVSNPVKVQNNTTEPVELFLEISSPAGWKTLGLSQRTVRVAPNDSTFIPVRLIPKAKMEGNTKYVVNALLRNAEGIPVAMHSFFCFTKKISKWEMNVGPTETIYFRNDEDQADFEVNVKNTGNHEEAIQLSLDGGQREDLVLMDTAENIIRRPTYTLDLEADEDTSLNFMVRPTQFQRNFRTVSLIAHRPFSQEKEQRFRYYAVTEEAKDIDDNSIKRGMKLDFVRLGNRKTVSPFGADHLPLIVEAQFQNILSDFSILNVNLSGIKQFEAQKRLVYFSQLFFEQSFFNRNLLDNTPWYVGYFEPKWDVQLGNVNGRTVGLPAAGKGITGSYQLHPFHRVGAFYTINPNLSQDRARSYGLFHDFMGNGNLRVASTLSYSSDSRLGRNSVVASSRASYRVARGQNVSILGAFSNTNSSTAIGDRNGYMVGATYSGVMVNQRLRTAITGRHTSPFFGLSSAQLTSFYNRTNFRLDDKTELNLLNNYNDNRRFDRFVPDSITGQFVNFTNRLNVSRRTSIGLFQPGLYYDIQEQPLWTNHSRGLILNYNQFDMQKNILFTTTIQAGYNNPKNLAEEFKEYFTARWSMLLRVRTLTLNMRYNYGPNNPLMLTTAFARFAYPKQFRGSLQYQHLFRNTRFVLQSNLTYAYNNQLQNHSVTAFPELFYFSESGWRFSVNANLIYNTTNISAVTEDLNQNLGFQRTSTGPVSNFNSRFGVTVRKEIGIPIPFTEQTNHDIEIVAFYDLDGNGVQNNDEPLIENVVVRLGKEEVMTDIEGQAALKNMGLGRFGLTIIPLDAPKGWFPQVPDSVDVMDDMVLNIPFVRGIKVSGQVIIDLDQRTVAEDERFDLTNIKITATNGKAYHTLTDFDGNFEFYLPNGDYTLTLDENILTEKYRLLQNNIPVTLANDLESMFVTFYIIEKRRKVNIKKFGQ